ncbi:MAG: lysine--tRNA ligase [Rhodospirillales bacterium]|nr:MAG: lysine--tRNA ligase [Rhodospirillales bacterium]
MAPEAGGEAPSEIQTAARQSNAWPFQEARALAARIGDAPPAKGHVLFETGYGPSGLPHIGTFGEVARTTMVRNAYALITGHPTRLLAFSDDMDGLRKVPDNVPGREAMARHLGKPLTAVPDPFGTHESFGAHNNARLRSFLDAFGFEYTFVSATECYRAGRFDAMLRRVLEHYDAITALILPTLGAERRATYSPFLPLCPRTGRVLQVPVIARDTGAGTIVYRDEDGTEVETPVTGGRCKLQWKVDWAMRWAALGVDYEMYGKDLIDSAKLSERICRILGSPPPMGFAYELFLDERGEKISKSRGNGLAVEEWLAYAPPESLALFMFQKPKAAKRLYFDVIPRTVDDYLALLQKLPEQGPVERLANPVWHIHRGEPPALEVAVSFSLLLNLASVCHTEDPQVLWHFITRYRPDVTPATAPLIDTLVAHAIRYYRDFVKPAKHYRPPQPAEALALKDLAETLRALPPDADAEAIQTEVYEVGKRHACFPDLRAWFRGLYQMLLGQEDGPRMGSFIALYGIDETIALIERAIRGQDLQPDD